MKIKKSMLKALIQEAINESAMTEPVGHTPCYIVYHDYNGYEEHVKFASGALDEAIEFVVWELESFVSNKYHPANYEDALYFYIERQHSVLVEQIGAKRKILNIDFSQYLGK